MTTSGPVGQGNPAVTLHASGLSAGYPDRCVIEHLDITIAPGCVTVLIGANASGKSTLLGTLARLLSPLAGTVHLDGIDIRSIPRRALARTLGILPQQPIAPDGLTVAELVARGRYPHRGLLGRWSADDARAVDAALTDTGMTELADRPVGELSGGQRQRAWIAMALAQEPRILLLDEPTTFLDLSHQLDVLDLVRRLNRERGTTVVVVLHELNLAARYADELVVMADGRVVAHGTPTEVLTPAVLASAFGLDALVIPDPLTHSPLVIPVPSDDPVARDRG
jgi:iron complex transport system ATP-binding protein